MSDVAQTPLNLHRFFARAGTRYYELKKMWMSGDSAKGRSYLRERPISQGTGDYQRGLLLQLEAPRSSVNKWRYLLQERRAG